jgi:hypothetical protein
MAGPQLPPLEPFELAAEHLHVTIDVGRGATVRELRAPGGANVLAERTWEAPLPASRSRSYGDGWLDWHADYPSGWQELFANAGDPWVVDGVPLPFHGEASVAHWDVLGARDDELHVRIVSRLPAVLERRMRLAPDRPALLLEEAVQNLSDRPLSVLWAHHPAFAARPAMRVDAPAARVCAERGWRPTHLDLNPGAEGRWPKLPGPDGAVDLSVVPSGPSSACATPPARRRLGGAVRPRRRPRRRAGLGRRGLAAPVALAGDRRDRVSLVRPSLHRRPGTPPRLAR